MSPRLFTVEQPRAPQQRIITAMTTNLSMSAEAIAESDRRWAQWIANGARRNRERQKRATTFLIAISFVLALWLAKVLVLG
jgi:hypothetical protein